MSVFEEIKGRVSTKEAAMFYGLNVDRKGMCCCPFHNDKTPSMKVDSRFHCFACGADGDVFDFVGRYFGLSAISSARKLNDDFSLGVDFGMRRHSPEEQAKILKQKEELEKKREAQRAFDAKRRNALFVLSDYHRLLWTWKSEYAPKDVEDADWHPLFVEALDRIDFITHLLDALSYGNHDQQAELLQSYEKEIRKIEQRIIGIN